MLEELLQGLDIFQEAMVSWDILLGESKDSKKLRIGNLALRTRLFCQKYIFCIN